MENDGRIKTSSKSDSNPTNREKEKPTAKRKHKVNINTNFHICCEIIWNAVYFSVAPSSNCFLLWKAHHKKKLPNLRDA